jgi:hypothetical protein
LQAALAREQDQLVRATGEVARALIETYRALGGGWQIRLSVPEPLPPVVPFEEEGEDVSGVNPEDRVILNPSDSRNDGAMVRPGNAP